MARNQLLTSANSQPGVRMGSGQGTHINGTTRLVSAVMETGQGLTAWPEVVREDFWEGVISQISFKDAKS